ncbi:MAG: flagellar assembly protein FliH [Selenomonadaceae bacterium]|nr:flagellar assembly protein FliH [Selenomonadaceae bacterium]
MRETKILKYAGYVEPFVIEAPIIKKAEPEEPEGPPPPSDEELFAREEQIRADEETAQRMLEDAYQKSHEADEKLKEADFQSKLLVQQTQDECDQILAEARKSSEENANKAFAEAQEKGYDDGYAKGHEEGYAKGYDEGSTKGREDSEEAVRTELKETIDSANAKAEKTIRDAKEQTSEYFIRAEDDVCKVVMLAIEKILPQHFLDVPQVVLPVVRDAIQRVRDQKEIKIHVEPNSYDLVLMARNEFQSMLTDGAAILEVVSDETLKPGDVVIETPNGGVDARLLTQIELMKNAIESVLNE